MGYVIVIYELNRQTSHNICENNGQSHAKKDYATWRVLLAIYLISI